MVPAEIFCGGSRLAIKSAIKGQYGLNSVPWGVVKGMKW